MTGHLRHFELGHNRAYDGITLHCLLCQPPGDPDGTAHIDDGMNLADVAGSALDHLAEDHPDVEP